MTIIPLFIGIPLGCAFAIYLFLRENEKGADWVANGCTLFLLVSSLLLINKVAKAGSLIYKMGGWSPPIGINLVLDGFSLFMLIVINLITFIATLYSVQYMKRFTAKAKYYTMFLLMVAGMNGVVLTGDLFNLYVFLEIASIASYVLVGFGIEHQELEAAFKYMVLGIIASTLILVGIAFIYGITGTLNMAHLSKIITQGGINPGFMVASAFFLVGFGLKAALVPFHAWLPDAHSSAPAPISAVLSGVLIKTLGIYTLMRIYFNVLGVSSVFSTILMTLGIISMVFGAFLSINQEDYKRLLAYSSISQVGYIVLGLGIGGSVIASGGSGSVAILAILGGLFHLVNHAIFKSLLFLTSGAVEFRTGTRKLKEMGGLTEKMPVTGITATIASLSIGGVPPFNGFWSKLIIIIAAIQAGYYVLAAIAIGISIVTLAIFLKVQRYAFFGKLPEKFKNITEVPGFMSISMIILAILCIGASLLLFPPVKAVILDIAAEALRNGTGYYAITILGR